jgi:hypothetical protein
VPQQSIGLGNPKQAAYRRLARFKATKESEMLPASALQRLLATGSLRGGDVVASRRTLLLASLLAGLPLAALGTTAQASPLARSETVITAHDDITFVALTGAPARSGEVATLYGGLDKPGPYLVLMKWHPGYMSAPHSYATDRLSLVLSGTWWVNSGPDFDPNATVPVRAGGFVRRVAHTPHYDGVKRNADEPAVIALSGIAPVDLTLVDPSKPGWRRV